MSVRKSILFLTTITMMYKWRVQCNNSRWKMFEYLWLKERKGQTFISTRTNTSDLRVTQGLSFVYESHSGHSCTVQIDTNVIQTRSHSENAAPNVFYQLLKFYHFRETRSLNRPYSYSRYWTGTSLEWRLMRGNIIVFEKTPPHQPHLQASSSPMPGIRIWPIGTQRFSSQLLSYSRCMTGFYSCIVVTKLIKNLRVYMQS